MNRHVGMNVALVAVFAALIAAFSFLPPILTIGAVPFALQLIIVLAAPLILGPWQGAGAVGLYVLVGVLGLPVFAGQSSGIGVIVGPTGGYVIGYVLAAIPLGYVASLALARDASQKATFVRLALAGLVGVLVIHIGGVAGLMTNAGMPFDKAFGVTAAFIPFDILKALIAAYLVIAVRKAFPRITAQRW